MAHLSHHPNGVDGWKKNNNIPNHPSRVSIEIIQKIYLSSFGTPIHMAQQSPTKGGVDGRKENNIQNIHATKSLDPSFCRLFFEWFFRKRRHYVIVLAGIYVINNSRGLLSSWSAWLPGYRLHPWSWIFKQNQSLEKGDVGFGNPMNHFQVPCSNFWCGCIGTIKWKVQICSFK